MYRRVTGQLYAMTYSNCQTRIARLLTCNARIKNREARPSPIRLLPWSADPLPIAVRNVRGMCAPRRVKPPLGSAPILRSVKISSQSSRLALMSLKLNRFRNASVATTHPAVCRALSHVCCERRARAIRPPTSTPGWESRPAPVAAPGRAPGVAPARRLTPSGASRARETVASSPPRRPPAGSG